jgi:hypothetical protein
LLLYETILESTDDYYHTTPINQIIFSYILIPENKNYIKESKISDISKNKKIAKFKLYGFNFPTTMNLDL